MARPIAHTVAHTVAAPPLLETKLYVPKRRSALVSRPRLVDLLAQGFERKLTLVSAPAGSGKTTLLTEWLASPHASGHGVAWVSLDPNDNDPARFWEYFIGALRTIDPEIGGHALSQLLAQERVPLEQILVSLLNDIASAGQHMALVLDDYHVIDSQTVHQTTQFVLDHQPQQLHLVLATRADPPLELARLRSQGEMIEARAADLRFTGGETEAFLTEVMGLPLAPAEIAALERRTEGWISGLQLAALSMQGRPDLHHYVQAFAGDDRYIVDYLVEEVLRRQPPDVRDFLLHTSILDRLCGPLCDAVTGQSNAKAVLASLELRNVFVVPLDGKRQWYRYHQLFGDVLRAHLMDEQPATIARLHQRAAMWFEQQAMIADALEHASASGDHALVARLLAAGFEEFERLGQYASIARWAASLPEDMIRQRPRLALIMAKAAFWIEPNHDAARKLTSWAEAAIDSLEQGDPGAVHDDGSVIGFDGRRALRGELLALKLFHSSRLLSAEEIGEIAEDALALLPPEKHSLRGMIHLIQAGIQLDLIDYPAALPKLERSIQEVRRFDNPTALACILEQRGNVSVAMGQLEYGRRSFEEALLAAQDVSAESTWVFCGPLASLAGVQLERGDLAGAVKHMTKALEYAGQSPRRSFLLHAWDTACEVFIAAGDVARAREQVAAAEEFARGARDFRFHAELSTMKLNLHCRLEELDAAGAVVEERALSPRLDPATSNDRELLAYARYLLARQHNLEALRLLNRAVPTLRERGRVEREIKALILLTVASARLGDRPAALTSLGRATMLGEPGRFFWSFAGEGPEVRMELASLHSDIGSGHGPGEHGGAAYLDYLMQAAEKREGVVTAAGVPALETPLTAREIEILRLIAAGLKNQEVADRLFISHSTVKRHIANIYGKLHASHRTEALNAARALSLL